MDGESGIIDWGGLSRRHVGVGHCGDIIKGRMKITQSSEGRCINIRVYDLGRIESKSGSSDRSVTGWSVVAVRSERGDKAEVDGANAAISGF